MEENLKCRLVDKTSTVGEDFVRIHLRSLYIERVSCPVSPSSQLGHSLCPPQDRSPKTPSHELHHGNVKNLLSLAFGAVRISIAKIPASPLVVKYWGSFPRTIGILGIDRAIMKPTLRQ